MWYICDVLYAVLYVRVNCFVVRGFVVSKKLYVFVVVMCLMLLIMFLHHLRLYVVYIHVRMYVCCGECYVVSNECDEPMHLTLYMGGLE